MRRLPGAARVLGRELRLCAGDLDILTLVLLAPLFYGFLYGAIYLHKSQVDADVLVVDLDRSASSRTLARWLDAHQKLCIHDEPDLGRARDRLANLEANAILVVPERFGADLKAGRGSDLELYLNNTRFLVSNDVNRAVSEVAGWLEAGVRLRALETRGLAEQQAVGLVEPIRVDARPVSNITESYGDFLIPGVLALILQQALLIGLALSVARERERSTLGELFETAGRSVAALLAGKITAYVLIFCAWAAFFLAVPFAVFHLPLRGSPAAVLLVCALHFLAVAGIAVLLASFFTSKLLVLQVLLFTSYPLFMLSGFSWPLEGLPAPLRVVAEILPTAPYMLAFQRLAQAGATLRHVGPEILQLALTAGGTLLASYARFRLEFRRSPLVRPLGRPASP